MQNKQFGCRPLWGRRKLPEGRHQTGQGPQRLCILRHASLVLLVLSCPISLNQPFAIAMLHRKIVACKRYLAAASGTLGKSSGTATEARLLAPRAANSTGIAQIKGKSLQDFSGKFPEMQDDIHSSRKLARCPPRRPHRHRCEYRDARGCQIGSRSSPPEAAS